MKAKSAFTLIEVMIVLSILSIIVILAYNFFGSTIKDASEKQLLLQTHNEMQAIAVAYEQYVIRYGKEMDSGLSYPAKMDLLVTEGLLREAMRPDPRIATLSDYAITQSPIADQDFAGAPNLDGYVQAAFVPTDHLCKKWNELYASGIGYNFEAMIPVGAKTRVVNRHNVFCVEASSNKYLRMVISLDSGVVP